MHTLKCANSYIETLGGRFSLLREITLHKERPIAIGSFEGRKLSINALAVKPTENK